MRVGPATNVARINVSETITALWTFAHANGISLDDIIERTADTGVTIDGLRLINGSIDKRDYDLVTRSLLVAALVGDSDPRYVQQADGEMFWGDGAGALDTNLFRALADVLATNDSFRVAGVLGLIVDDITERTPTLGVMIDGTLLKDGGIDLAGDIEFSERNLTMADGANADVATGTATVQRTALAGPGASECSGYAGGRAGRVIIICRTGGGLGLELEHEAVASAAANRMILPGAASVFIGNGEAASLWYDTTDSRWRMFTVAV